MRIERLGGLGTAGDVLCALAAAARSRGLPPPAAFVGDWFGSAAVIAPSVAIAPTDPADVFAVAPGERTDAVGGGWIGYLSYPDPAADGRGPRIPEAAGGWTDCVLRLDTDGCWWHESLSGATVQSWVAIAMASQVPREVCEIDWAEPDFAAHQAGVLDCLAAIASGECYQACVCTQFTGTVTGSPVDFFADAVTRTAP
ncbi:MAG TPA: aminodeoxychorismate synthase component I, partial [Mycobacterium sp.]|nr:aminodeoxychorismate synthase component I [Mycobacterium sp.]